MSRIFLTTAVWGAVWVKYMSNMYFTQKALYTTACIDT